MTCIINDNIYDMTLISEIKEQIGPKKLKKITKNLRNIAEYDVKKFSELNIKAIEEKNEKEKKPEFKIVAPTIVLQHCIIENFKKPNLKLIFNIDDELEGENSSAVINKKKK